MEKSMSVDLCKQAICDFEQNFFRKKCYYYGFNFRW